MDASRYIEDFDFLVDTVDRVHPCPDLTSTRHQLEAQRDRLRRDLAECRTDGDFWHVAQAYLVTVGDGHTNLRSPIKSDFRQAGLVTSLVDGQVVVAEVIDSESAPEVHVGDIILGVNGHDVETRLGEVIRSQPSDTVRSARFRAARDALVFVGSTSETCTVTLSAVNGSVYDTTLRLLGFSGPIADHDRQERVIDHKECVTTFFWEAASAGCLRLRSCMDRTTIQQEWLDGLDLTLDDVPDMESVCWDFFSALRASRARKAIIDIRGNGGGNSSVGATLLKYLTRKPIESYRGDTKVSEETKKWFPNEPIGSVARGTAGVRAFPYQTRLSEDQLKTLPAFEGQVIALLDTGVYSSAEWLAAELAANNLATLIGEPTGGGGSRPGEQLNFALPNTGLTLWVSSKLWVPPGGQLIEQRGVYPDYWVKPTVDDVRNDVDRVMEFALSL